MADGGEGSLDYLEEWDPDRGVSFAHHCLAGSMSGLAEHCCMFPLDTIKTNAQCDGACGTRRPDVLCFRAAKQLMTDTYSGSSGLRLWRGVGAVTLACIPAHAVYFGLFESTRSVMQSASRGRGARDVGDDVLANGLAGAVAAVGHDVIMTPADVIKQRLQLGHHSGVVDAFRSVVAADGAAGLYRSLPVTLAMNIPNGSITVAANEFLKARLRKVQHSAEPLGIGSLLACGGLAGGFASLLTTPFDVVKTRLQTQGLQQAPARPPAAAAACPRNARQLSSFAAPEAVRYRGFADAARAIWVADGPRGFFRGAAMRVLAQAPSVAVVWTVYETLVHAKFS